MNSDLIVHWYFSLNSLDIYLDNIAVFPTEIEPNNIILNSYVNFISLSSMEKFLAAEAALWLYKVGHHSRWDK